MTSLPRPLVSNLGEISGSTTGSGAGGSLDITAQQIQLNGGQITADTMAPATVPIPLKVSNLTVTLDIAHSHDENLDVLLFSQDGHQSALERGELFPEDALFVRELRGKGDLEFHKKIAAFA